MVDLEFTKWDKIDIQGPMTIKEVKEHFEKLCEMNVSMITYGNATILNVYSPDLKKRLPQKVPEAIEDILKK